MGISGSQDKNRDYIDSKNNINPENNIDLGEIENCPYTINMISFTNH